ncbi:hypothetical protein [Actinacidiphila glaucinigra]|uniref:hypothetical protein n=1 Tax=Actinacidiphila glaucinigra TaxID=235986 RepID=UPI003D91789F
MRARDLVVELPNRELGQRRPGRCAAIGRAPSPGVLVLKEDGAPPAILPASRLVKLLVPDY